MDFDKERFMKEDIPEFSIIIPVFNAENTIDRCLQSVAGQTMNSFEAIIVDDGSKDRSLALCGRFSEADKRFYLYQQDHLGVSAARNRALDMARGRWICFLDSDDWLQPDYLESIQGLTGEADAVFIGYRKTDSQGNLLEIRLPEAKGDNIKKLALQLSRQDMFGYTWIKAFSSRAVGSIRFPEDMSLFEDEIFACHVLAACSGIRLLEKAVYNYVQPGEQALTSGTYQNYCTWNDRVYQAWKKLLVTDRLVEKAGRIKTRCICYGFEKDICAKKYFTELSESSFFMDSFSDTVVDRCIRRRSAAGIRIMRGYYRFKHTAASVLRRIKK